MHRKKRLTFLGKCILILACYVMPVHAVLVDRDWAAEGDALITYDTKTGLEWLDVPATADMPYNDVISEINTLAIFSGFTYATKEQVIKFFNSGRLVEFFDSTNAPEEVTKIENFLSYWGVGWYLGNGQRTEFLTGNTQSLPLGEHWSGRLIWLPPGTAAYTAELEGRNDNGDSGFTFGSALVRNAIPVTLDGDLNEDGKSNAGDLKIMMDIILDMPVDRSIEPGHGDYYPPGNPDGIINMSDLILMLSDLL